MMLKIQLCRIGCNINQSLFYKKLSCKYLKLCNNKIRSSSTITSHSTLDARYNNSTEIELLNQKYAVDSCTNITPRITSKLNKQLHNKKGHPLFLTRQRIQNYFYNNFLKSSGNPLFAVFDNISPIVTPHQNFDSLLFPADHPGRSAADTYYINSKFLLRSHITAHDEELMKMGFNAFLSVGDVFRRDEIDCSHYPAFHQLDGLRLFSEQELFHRVKDPTGMQLFENGNRTADKQERHTVDASKVVEFDLKHVLVGVAQKLFGNDVKLRWVDCYFPFTHPSWELEIYFNDQWMEVLGCGVLEQAIIDNAGAGNKVGWAFGIGLDRLAMIQYQIPDIRLLWSEDRRFLDQFSVNNPETRIIYKPISKYMSRQTDISFWIPDSFVSSDFYDLVRSVGGDNIERVSLIDTYSDAKTGKTSHCYTITYQHMERVISTDEVKQIHDNIAELAKQHLGVQIR